MLLMLTTLRTRGLALRERAYSWLDTRLFSWLIAYAASPAHILALLLIWLGLLAGGAWAAWELVGGNYTNGISAIGACIILYRQVRSEARASERHQELLDAHQRHHERLSALEGRMPTAPEPPPPPPPAPRKPRATRARKAQP